MTQLALMKEPSGQPEKKGGLIKNDGYALRYKDGKFYRIDSDRVVSQAEIGRLNTELEKRRALAIPEDDD